MDSIWTSLSNLQWMGTSAQCKTPTLFFVPLPFKSATVPWDLLLRLKHGYTNTVHAFNVCDDRGGFKFDAPDAQLDRQAHEHHAWIVHPEFGEQSHAHVALVGYQERGLKVHFCRVVTSRRFGRIIIVADSRCALDGWRRWWRWPAHVILVVVIDPVFCFGRSRRWPSPSFLLQRRRVVRMLRCDKGRSMKRVHQVKPLLLRIQERVVEWKPRRVEWIAGFACCCCCCWSMRRESVGRWGRSTTASSRRRRRRLVILRTRASIRLLWCQFVVVVVFIKLWKRIGDIGDLDPRCLCAPFECRDFNVTNKRRFADTLEMAIEEMLNVYRKLLIKLGPVDIQWHGPAKKSKNAPIMQSLGVTQKGWVNQNG